MTEISSGDADDHIPEGTQNPTDPDTTANLTRDEAAEQPPADADSSDEVPTTPPGADKEPAAERDDGKDSDDDTAAEQARAAADKAQTAQDEADADAERAQDERDQAAAAEQEQHDREVAEARKEVERALAAADQDKQAPPAEGRTDGTATDDDHQDQADQPRPAERPGSEDEDEAEPDHGAAEPTGQEAEEPGEAAAADDPGEAAGQEPAAEAEELATDGAGDEEPEAGEAAEPADHDDAADPVEDKAGEQAGDEDEEAGGGEAGGAAGGGNDAGGDDGTGNSEFGAEQWENPRGVKLMAPLANIETASTEGLGPDAAAIVEANRVVLEEAQAAGVEIVDTSNMTDDERSEVAAGQPVTFDVQPSPDFTIEHEREVVDELAQQGHLVVPHSQPLVGSSYEEMRDLLREQGPFMLVRQDQEAGQGKYLIENEHQVANLARLLDSDDIPLLDKCQIQEYVPTPTNHYTSLKLVTNPDAHVVAATLLYSQHTEDDRHNIIELTDTRGADPLRVLLEHPESPVFLGARDVVSNAASGAVEIPLIGQYAGQLRPGEAEILAAHGIDPSRPAVPADIMAQVPLLAPLTRLAGLASSVDYIQDADTGQNKYLETNAGPDATTYATCWLGNPADPARYEAMLRHAARDLVQAA